MGLFSSKKKKQVIGYRYYIGMHMITGHANTDGVERIRVGEKVAWTQSNVLKDNHITVKTALAITSKGWVSQTFIPTSRYTLNSIALMMYRDTGHTPGTLSCSIRAIDGSGHPIGDDLCVGTTDGDTLPIVFNLNDAEWREIEFEAPIILETGIKYAIILHATDSNSSSDTVKWIADNTSGYANGNVESSSNAGKTWASHAQINLDLLFKCYKKDGDAPNSTITISSDNLFGGNRKEGGVSGDIDLMFGTSDQTQNDYLIERLDANIPAYRGVFGAVLNQVYIGTSSYLKPWSFLCKRVCKQIDGTDQWYKEKAVIRPREVDGDDLNAIHILRECLIAPEWGLGWSASDIDDDSFKEAANILYDEGFGLSMLWDQVEPMEDFVNEILNYITGILYQDLSTGRWVISLTRDNAYETAYDRLITGDNNQGSAAFPGTRWFAQSFTPTRSYTAASCKIKIYKSTLGTIDVRCELQGTDVNGHPDGNVIAQGTISTANINEESAGASWVSCIFHKKGVLTIGTKYTLVVKSIDGIGTLYWRVNTFSDFYTGEYLISNDTGSTWSNVDQNDFMFEIYAGGELETFDESQITEIEDFSRLAYGETVNAVTVKFWDKLNHKTRSTEDRDIALISKQNGIVIEKILNYQGICNEELANDVAARELKLASQMLAAIRLKCTRALSHLKPNDVFLFSWPPLGITQMALRVLNADYGSLHNNRVILTCAEDEFGAAVTIYGAVPETLQTDPISDAVDVVNKRIIEIPYWSLVNDIYNSKDVVATLDNDFTRMAIVAGKPVSDAFDFDLWTRFSASYEYIDVGQGSTNFCPYGTLTDGLAQNGVDIDITLATSTDLDDITVGSYAIIGNEYFMVNSVNITTKIINISRAVLDTTPELHNAGDVIYFASLHYSDVEQEYTKADSPNAKLLTRTGSGSLAIGDATVLSSTAFDSRQVRPYPPGNLKINSESFPSHVSSGAHGNKITLTWNHRDRTHATQLNSLVLHTAGNNYGPETGITYTIKIYGEADTLGRTIAGLSAVTVSYDYTEAFETSDFGALQETLRFVVYAVRDGYNSWRDGYNITVQRSMRGNVSAVSSVFGDMAGYFEGIITGSSGVNGLLNIETEMAGSINAASGTSSDLNIPHKLIGSISGVSNVSGDLSSTYKFVGSVLSASNCSGSLTGVSGETLMESYTAGIDSQGVAYWSGATDQWLAQTFTASENYDIIKTIVKLYKTAGSPGNITLAIKATDGSGKPTGADLVSTSADANGFTTDSAGEEISFDFSAYSLTNGTKYAIVLKSPAVENTYVRWKLDISGAGYSDGSYLYSSDGGSSWTAATDSDCYFKNYK